MNETKKSVSLNTEIEMQSEEKENISVPSAKNKVLADGKLTFLEILYVARYFLPVLTTVGWIIGLTFVPDDGTFLMIFSLVLVGLGLLAAATVCPLKLLSLPFKWAGRGFFICRSLIPIYGVADLFAALVGVTGGFLLGIILIFGLPAVFTIKKFFSQDSVG